MPFVTRADTGQHIDVDIGYLGCGALYWTAGKLLGQLLQWSRVQAKQPGKFSPHYVSGDYTQLNFADIPIANAGSRLASELRRLGQVPRHQRSLLSPPRLKGLERTQIKRLATGELFNTGHRHD